MDPLQDRQSSFLMGNSNMKAKNPDGEDAKAKAKQPSPHVPLPGQFLPYKGSPDVYSSKYPPTAANPKDCSSESFSAWYASSKYDKWTDDHTEPYKFRRFIFAMVVALIISLSMASLVIWLLFGVDVATFRVSSLSVSNLVISHSIIRATWTANITITNPNPDIKVRGDLLMASVLYKDYPLAMAAVTPNNTQAHNEEGRSQVSSVFKINNDTDISNDVVAAEVTQALKSGVMHVSLRIASGAQIISNSGWSPDSFKIFCENLKLLISPAGNGDLAQDSPRDCLIFESS